MNCLLNLLADSSFTLFEPSVCFLDAGSVAEEETGAETNRKQAQACRMRRIISESNGLRRRETTERKPTDNDRYPQVLQERRAKRGWVLLCQNEIQVNGSNHCEPNNLVAGGSECERKSQWQKDETHRDLLCATVRVKRRARDTSQPRVATSEDACNMCASLGKQRTLAQLIDHSQHQA